MDHHATGREEAAGNGKNGEIALVDTHAHLTHEAFADDLDDVLGRSHAAGVTRILCVGDQLISSEQSSAMADRYEGMWSTAGVHPHHAAEVGDDLEARLKALLRHPKVVAVGEVGLDYYYDFAPVAVQQDVFRRQIRVARELGLPLIIHSRESMDDVLAILKDEKAHEVGGVLHCFWGERHHAGQALELGFHLGVGGPVTFKKSDDLRALLKDIPLDRLLVETDAPYLAPTPHRGKRNEPAYTRLSAEHLAKVKEIGLDEVAAVTTRNALALFKIT